MSEYSAGESKLVFPVTRLGSFLSSLNSFFPVGRYLHIQRVLVGSTSTIADEMLHSQKLIAVPHNFGSFVKRGRLSERRVVSTNENGRGKFRPYSKKERKKKEKSGELQPTQPII